MHQAIQELLTQLKPGINIEKIKREISKKYKLSKFPSNIEILEELNEEQKQLYKKLLVTKPMRTMSKPSQFYCKKQSWLLLTPTTNLIL